MTGKTHPDEPQDRGTAPRNVHDDTGVHVGGDIAATIEESRNTPDPGDVPAAKAEQAAEWLAPHGEQKDTGAPAG